MDVNKDQIVVQVPGIEDAEVVVDVTVTLQPEQPEVDQGEDFNFEGVAKDEDQVVM